MGLIDPAKTAFREAVRDAKNASEDVKIMNAFRDGTAVGLCIGAALATFGWVTFFWLASLASQK